MLIRTDAIPVGAAYVEIDQRNVEAPLPPGVQRYVEADAYTCSHCQRIVILNPDRTRERYKCNGCNHHICDDCAAAKFGGAPCKTFAQKVDEELERAARQAAPLPLILP